MGHGAESTPLPSSGVIAIITTKLPAQGTRMHHLLTYITRTVMRASPLAPILLSFQNPYMLQLCRCTHTASCLCLGSYIYKGTTYSGCITVESTNRCAGCLLHYCMRRHSALSPMMTAPKGTQHVQCMHAAVRYTWPNSPWLPPNRCPCFYRYPKGSTEGLLSWGMPWADLCTGLRSYSGITPTIHTCWPTDPGAWCRAPAPHRKPPPPPTLPRRTRSGYTAAPTTCPRGTTGSRWGKCKPPSAARRSSSSASRSRKVSRCTSCPHRCGSVGVC